MYMIVSSSFSSILLARYVFSLCHGIIFIETLFRDQLVLDSQGYLAY